MMIPKKAFVCLSVVTVAVFLKLSPVRGKLIFFDKDSMKHLLAFVRENDTLFIDLLA